jgi:hypothetical protein
MIVIGNPQASNDRLVSRIRTVLDFSPLPKELDENYFRSILHPEMRVLDVGQSLREHFTLVSSLVNGVDTLDINVFHDYPDIQMDLCERNSIPLHLKYDVIFCFSLLEHCYSPSIAAENLYQMLKPDSRIVGSVPFLFPHHCPENLIYQDYFRFTKFSFVALFPKAKQIRVSPQRGRVGAGLNIISQRYKDIFENVKTPVCGHKSRDCKQEGCNLYCREGR